ncbi:MAG: hypothetical protein HUU27_11700 [Phycisphaerae bacterium]|nr:hypothetical protein [Phycisphaerae bacterium]
MALRPIRTRITHAGVIAMMSGPAAVVDVVRGVVLAGLASAVALGQTASERRLPFTESYPRTREGAAAYGQGKGELVSHGDGLAPELLRMTQERMGLWEARFLGGDIADAATVEGMIDELYFDCGDPSLNAAFQHSFVQVVLAPASRWPAERLPDRLRRRLAEGLAEYVGAGGASWVPFARADTAAVMRRLAGDDRDLAAKADEVLSDAVLWADEWGDATPTTMRTYTVAEREWGSDYRLWAYALANRMPALPDVPDKLPRAYAEAVEAINRAMPPEMKATASRGEWPRRLRDADRLVRVELGSELLESDLAARFLLLLRAVAEAPEAPAEIAAFVDRALIEVVRDERVKSELHWRLWEGAVRALGHSRVSVPLKQWIQRSAAEKEDSARRATARRLVLFLDAASGERAARPR